MPGERDIRLAQKKFATHNSSQMVDGNFLLGIDFPFGNRLFHRYRFEDQTGRYDMFERLDESEGRFSVLVQTSGPPKKESYITGFLFDFDLDFEGNLINLRSHDKNRAPFFTVYFNSMFTEVEPDPELFFGHPYEVHYKPLGDNPDFCILDIDSLSRSYNREDLTYEQKVAIARENNLPFVINARETVFNVMSEEPMTPKELRKHPFSTSMSF